MKKILCLLSVSVLFLSSCSSDSSSSSDNPPSQNLLLQRTVEDNLGLGSTTTYYYYNGNKLTGINRNGEEYDIYTYTGNLITKIQHYSGPYTATPTEDAELRSTDIFEYNTNNQLIKFKTTKPNSSIERETTYTYNNNIVTFQQYEYYPGNTPELLKSGTITLQNGEIVRLQVVKEFDSYTDNYTYDTKNSLFKNVLGYDKLMFTHIIGKQGSKTLVDSILGGISHNFVNNAEYEYTYNSDNYPVAANHYFFGSLLVKYYFYYE
ncbi:hypothetical protein KIH23_11885 [Flavobacterium sp. CYK-55]|uniref:hypothetical protein n=1 Tax=Flavobacterium sp. CYK-55 TaxID=2835529 RepID=UPI001BD09296|nr:hypothetical protein [Flavobacterium sp. CYK-55]MBS7787998.1 hypothetical protein [Flavobacterium sp. CYK-55]